MHQNTLTGANTKTTMKITELKKMWSEFGDIPVNDNDEIELDFYYWEKGTDRFDIWQWFDELLPNGISELITNYCN